MAEFDTFAANYQELVSASVRISGEPSDYFAAYKAAYIARRITPREGGKVLDYGCGVGLLARHLKSRLGGMRIDGFDVSKDSIEQVEDTLVRQGTFDTRLNELSGAYDVIVLSNVLHHVKAGERQDVVREAASRLADHGTLFVFEHNPINPLTRWAVSQCPFDEGAVLLPSHETRGYVQRNGLRLLWREYIVFFPRGLGWFRRLEPSLRWCPLGAQYVVAAGKLPG